MSTRVKALGRLITIQVAYQKPHNKGFVNKQQMFFVSDQGANIRIKIPPITSSQCRVDIIKEDPVIVVQQPKTTILPQRVKKSSRIILSLDNEIDSETDESQEEDGHEIGEYEDVDMKEDSNGDYDNDVEEESDDYYDNVSSPKTSYKKTSESNNIGAYDKFVSALLAKSDEKLNWNVAVDEWILSVESLVPDQSDRAIYYCICGRQKRLNEVHIYTHRNDIKRTIVVGSECAKHFKQKESRLLKKETKFYGRAGFQKDGFVDENDDDQLLRDLDSDLYTDESEETDQNQNGDSDDQDEETKEDEQSDDNSIVNTIDESIQEEENKSDDYDEEAEINIKQSMEDDNKSAEVKKNECNSSDIESDKESINNDNDNQEHCDDKYNFEEITNGDRQRETSEGSSIASAVKRRRRH